ncbi:hypothetical protein [Streptomyces sp. NPDC059916]|uniref:hypothetical protein n=1 Tax=Streptomyces sp. NPDC059916 TaxID=3347001 RepID=UPI0036958EF0
MTEQPAAALNPQRLPYQATQLHYSPDGAEWTRTAHDTWTTHILLTGPDGERYYVELDPERTAELRRDLAGGPDNRSCDLTAPADQAADREKLYEAGMRRIPGWSSGKVRIRDAVIAAMVVADAESSRLRADLADAEEDIDGWRAVLRRSDNRNDQLRAEVERLRVGRASLLREFAEIAEGQRQLGPAFGARKSAQVSENVGILRVSAEFRRLAAEAEYVATPCSPGGCEPGDPCSTHERLMAHGEGDHELCEPNCGTSVADEAQQAGEGR